MGHFLRVAIAAGAAVLVIALLVLGHWAGGILAAVVTLALLVGGDWLLAHIFDGNQE
jgi:hypothetical protein